jgi:hypothetical protein
MFNRSRFFAVCAVASTLVATLSQAVFAQGPVTITATPLGSGITMLEGRGGNIAIVDGDEKPGVLMVDSQFANVAPKSPKSRGRAGSIF